MAARRRRLQAGAPETVGETLLALLTALLTASSSSWRSTRPYSGAEAVLKCQALPGWAAWGAPVSAAVRYQKLMSSVPPLAPALHPSNLLCRAQIERWDGTPLGTTSSRRVLTATVDSADELMAMMQVASGFPRLSST